MQTTDSAAPGHDWLGETLDGRYRIDRVLGAGGLGTVYLATHLRLDRPVAIKMLHRELLPNLELRKRFDREVKTLSRLAHPHIVALTDSGVLDDGMGYLVMELLEGHSLEERLSKQGALEPSEAIEITRQMLLGLAEAHDKGVLHRDLKPANVFIHPLAEGLHVKLLDFGLAKVRSDIATHPGDYPTLTADGVIVGTPTYMAPEQATGGGITAATDLYAVGIVLYEMLVGRPPFRSENKIETIRAHMLAPVPTMESFAPELQPTEALRQLVGRALQKERGQRFADARAMLKELDALPRPAAVLASGGRPARPIATRSSASSAGTEDTLALRSGEIEPVDSHVDALSPTQRPPPPPPASPARSARPSPRVLALGIGSVAVVCLIAIVYFASRSSEPSDLPTGPLDATHAEAERTPPPSATTAPHATTTTDARATDTDATDDGSDAASPFTQSALPDELRAARRDILGGHALSDAEQRAVEAYRRAHPQDARAPLLLARSARFHGEWRSMVTLYAAAYRADASSVGFAPMLGDLVHAAGEASSSTAASNAVVRMFGSSARAAVDAYLAELPSGAERRRVTQLRRRLGPG